MFFSSACVMSFHVCFFLILSEISMAPQFHACRTGLQQNGIFYPHNLLFFDLDFSHCSILQLHHVARGYSEIKVFSFFPVFVTARCTFFDVWYG